MNGYSRFVVFWKGWFYWMILDVIVSGKGV